MHSSVSINGTKIEERSGVFYINGKRIVNNYISSFEIKASTFFVGAVFGALFVILLAEFGAQL